MAYSHYNLGLNNVYKFTDVFADFPAAGKKLSGSSALLIDNSIGTVAVDVYYTFDSYASVDAGTATYVKITSVAASSTLYQPFDTLSPSGIKLVATATGASAWIVT